MRTVKNQAVRVYYQEKGITGQAGVEIDIDALELDGDKIKDYAGTDALIGGYVYGVMADKAGYQPAAVELTADNIYSEILAASEALDDAEFPETGRVLLVTPGTTP